MDLPDVPTDNLNQRRRNPPGRRQRQCDNLPFKREVEFISSHKMERDSVKFTVKWANFTIFTKEKASLIIEKKNGKKVLKEYLRRVNYRDEFEWERMIQREPNLIEFMRESPTVRRRRNVAL